MGNGHSTIYITFTSECTSIAGPPAKGQMVPFFILVITALVLAGFIPLLIHMISPIAQWGRCVAVSQTWREKGANFSVFSFVILNLILYSTICLATIEGRLIISIPLVIIALICFFNPYSGELEEIYKGEEYISNTTGKYIHSFLAGLFFTFFLSSQWWILFTLLKDDLYLIGMTLAVINSLIWIIIIGAYIAGLKRDKTLKERFAWDDVISGLEWVFCAFGLFFLLLIDQVPVV